MISSYPKTLILFVLLIVFLISGISCSSKDKQNFSEDAWADRVEKTGTEGLYAPHFVNGKFFAPWMKMPDKTFLDVLGWKLFSKTNYTDAEEKYLPEILPDTLERVKQAKGDFILWIGHNTFLVKVDDTYWLTDPIFTKRALLPPRVTPPALSLEEISENFENLNIVISHNHYDHLNKESIEALPEQAKVFVPLGLKTLVEDMNKRHVREMDWWEKTEVAGGSTLTCLPAQHWSLRIGQGRNESLWASWMLVTPKGTFYFGGDSGYFKGFEEIGKKFDHIDYAFLATTAYHPRWFMHYQHMNIPEAVRAFNDLGARFFIPTQWGTFRLGDEPPGYPALDLKRNIVKNQLDSSRFKIMNIGQILLMDSGNL